MWTWERKRGGMPPPPGLPKSDPSPHKQLMYYCSPLYIVTGKMLDLGTKTKIFGNFPRSQKKNLF